MLIPCDEVNILNTFRVMIILRLLLLLTNLHLKLLSTQGTDADKLLSTQRVKFLMTRLSVCSLGVSCNEMIDTPMLLVVGKSRVSVAYYSFYDNIQLYEPLGKALLFTSIS